MRQQLTRSLAWLAVDLPNVKMYTPLLFFVMVHGTVIYSCDVDVRYALTSLQLHPNDLSLQRR